MLASTPLSAAEYSGSARIGGVSSKVDFPGDIQGETNDIQVLSSRLKMDVDGLTRKDDYISVDARDRYDFFGKSQSEIQSLEAENTLQVREAAYKRPWERNRSFFEIGRFSVSEAGIIANDGGSYGYRFTKNLRLVGFLGLAAEDIVTPASINPDVRGFDGNQGGAFLVYEKKGGMDGTSTYMTNSVAQAPSFELNEFINRVFFFHQGVFNLGLKHRISTLIDTDLAPSSNLRRGFLTYAYYSARHRVRITANRITAEDYRINREIRDELEPSTLTAARLTYQYRINKSLQSRVFYGNAKRSIDGLSSQHYYVGISYNGLLKKRLSLALRYGIKDDFLSDDTYIYTQASYYSKSWDFLVSYTQEQEKSDSGEEFNPSTIGTELGFYLSDKTRGSLGYSQSSAEDRSISSFMFMIGYRFGTEATSPIRRRTPTFEEL